MSKTTITPETIEVTNGGIKHLIFRKYIKVITENKVGKFCEIYVEEVEEPFIADINYEILRFKMNF